MVVSQHRGLGLRIFSELSMVVFTQSDRKERYDKLAADGARASSLGAMMSWSGRDLHE